MPLLLISIPSYIVLCKDITKEKSFVSSNIPTFPVAPLVFVPISLIFNSLQKHAKSSQAEPLL